MRADDVTPHAFAPDRYAKMGEHSPFTPTTPQAAPTVAPTPPPKPSFAEKLTISNLAEDHGVFLATVVDPESSTHTLINSDPKDQTAEIKITDVKWPRATESNPDGGQQAVMITIRKGTETATVRYDPGSAGSGAMGGMAAPGGMGGNKPFIPGNAGVRPLGAPTLPGTVNGPGLAVAPQTTGMPANNANNVNNPLRRMPIRSFPQPAAPAATAVRPVLPGNTAVQGARPGLATKVDDDDDDDD